MKNAYLFSYLPIISILLFSLSFAIYGEMQMLKLFGNSGIYQGMLEFFSEAGIKLALLIVLLLFRRLSVKPHQSKRLALSWLAGYSPGVTRIFSIH